MRVLIATPLYPPEVGGPATITRLLERELSKRQIGVSVVSFHTVRHVPFGIRHFVFLCRLLWKARMADVLLSLDSRAIGVPALLTSWIAQVPLVVRLGGIGSWERATQSSIPAGLPHEFKQRLHTFSLYVRIVYLFERVVLGCAHSIIVPSRYLKDVLVGLGIKECRIHVVYNGLAPITTIPHLLPGYPRIVSAGRLARIKRFDVLIGAVSLLAEKIPDIRLDLYGEGPSHAELEHLIAEHALERIVRILPPLPADELFQEIRNASVFALSSDHETFSNLIVEAMAVGTPVVTTDVGGTPEIITNGVNGLLVPPGDSAAFAEALLKVGNDPAFGKKLTEAATSTLERFSASQAVDGIMDVLKRTVQ